MQFSKDFIRKVAESADLVDLISERGVTLKRSGATYKGLCPFHAEKTPSFNVNPQRGFFHCFGCGVSGDGIKFLRQHDRLSFVEAVEELAKRAGIPLEGESYKGAGTSRRTNPESEPYENSGLRCLKEAASFYKERLTNSSEESKSYTAVNYLHERMIPENMWAQFQIGVSPDEWQGTLHFLRQKNFSVEEMQQVGLVKVSEKSARHYDTFRSRLMFPIRDVRGRCIGFGARAVKAEDQPKYLNSPETSYYRKSRVLYGLYEGLSAIRQARQLIFVEGYLDVIRLHEFGFPQTVAPCGTALTAEHLKTVRRYADTVILLFDGDTAGRNAALKHAHLFLPHALEAYILTLPEGEDPDTFLLNHGKEGFETLLVQKIPALDYLLRETLKKYPDSIQGRMRALEELLPTLREIHEPKRQQLTLMVLSERLRIAPEILFKEIGKKNKKKSPNTSKSDTMENLPIDGKQSKHEQWLLQSLLRQGGFWPFVRQHLQAEEFQTPQYRYLYAELLQFPDEKLQTFDPLSIEHSAPELFRSVMLLLAEEIPLHEFKVSLEQIKKRNLAIQDQERRSGGNEEEKLLSGKYKREEEKKLQEILANLPTL